ncbi:hypothetical protein L9F63_018335, partial [Diploptera punctata]
SRLLNLILLRCSHYSISDHRHHPQLFSRLSIFSFVALQYRRHLHRALQYQRSIVVMNYSPNCHL